MSERVYEMLGVMIKLLRVILWLLIAMMAILMYVISGNFLDSIKVEKLECNRFMLLKDQFQHKRKAFIRKYESMRKSL